MPTLGVKYVIIKAKYLYKFYLQEFVEKLKSK